MIESIKDKHYQQISDCYYLREISNIEVPDQSEVSYIFYAFIFSILFGLVMGGAFIALGSLLLIGAFVLLGHFGAIEQYMGILFQLGFFITFFGTLTFGVMEHIKANKKINNKIESFKNKLFDEYSIAFNDKNEVIKSAGEARKRLKNSLEADEQFLTYMLEDIENGSFSLNDDVKSWVLKSARKLNEEREQAIKLSKKEKENAKKFRAQLKGEPMEKPKEKVKIEEHD